MANCLKNDALTLLCENGTKKFLNHCHCQKYTCILISFIVLVFDFECFVNCNVYLSPSYQLANRFTVFTHHLIWHFMTLSEKRLDYKSIWGTCKLQTEINEKKIKRNM